MFSRLVAWWSSSVAAARRWGLAARPWRGNRPKTYGNPGGSRKFNGTYLWKMVIYPTKMMISWGFPKILLVSWWIFQSYVFFFSMVCWCMLFVYKDHENFRQKPTINHSEGTILWGGPPLEGNEPLMGLPTIPPSPSSGCFVTPFNLFNYVYIYIYIYPHQHHKHELV